MTTAPAAGRVARGHPSRPLALLALLALGEGLWLVEMRGPAAAPEARATVVAGPIPAPPSRAAPPPPAAVLAPLAGYRDLQERPLFSPTRRPVVAEPVALAPAGERFDPEDFRLTAVVLSPGRRMALVEDRRSKARVWLGEGEPLPGEPAPGSVAAIPAGHLTIDADGRQAVLLLWASDVMTGARPVRVAHGIDVRDDTPAGELVPSANRLIRRRTIVTAAGTPPARAR